MNNQMKKTPGFLAVGNFDSNVGYAWRLMESFWCNMSRQLKPLGYQPHVCFPSISIIPACLAEENFKVHRIDFTKADIKSVFLQVLFIWKNNIKLLYLTDFKTFDIRYIFYRLAGAHKIITHDHSPGTRPHPRRLIFTIKKVLHKISFACADMCLAVSPYVRQRMIDINGVPKAKAICVTNGIPVLNSEAPTAKQKLALQIITVSRANYYKGIDFALQVIAELLKKEQPQPITYILYGDGPNLEDFRKLADELNIAKYVFFAGKIDNIAEKLLEADIAFHPSKGEAMSLAILEYMRAGLPVVVSSNPSVSSFLKDEETALIYTEESIKAAASQMERLINDESLRLKIGTNGWSAVYNEFNDKLMFEKFNQSIIKIAS